MVRGPVDGRAANHHRVVGSGAHLQYSGAVADDASLADALATGASRVVIDAADLDGAFTSTEAVAAGAARFDLF